MVINIDPMHVENAARQAEQFLDALATYLEAFEDRGIVICAGGIRYNTCTWVLIKMLRHLGCTLPIQVWYRGAAERDEAWIELVRPMNVQCIDACHAAPAGTIPRLGGWELKPYAILHSPFREVLLLDADNVPVRDPTYLFDDPEYLRTGAIFWPDGYRTPPDSDRWRIFGVDYRDEPEQESGQVLVNKEVAWRALNLCCWYNRHSDFFYKYVYGDKDTFRFAWHRTNTKYAMPERGIEVIPATLCQHDMQGRRLFQHRFGDKWSLAGNRRCAGFLHEDRCLQYLDELRAQWNPLTSVAGQLSAEDRAAMTQLAGRKLRYVRVGAAHWEVTLAEAGYFAEGATSAAFLWWRQGEELLFAGSDGRVTHRFRPAAQDRWEGCLSESKNRQVRLVPA